MYGDRISISLSRWPHKCRGLIGYSQKSYSLMSRVIVLLPRRRGCFHMGLFNKFAHGICEQPCKSLGVMVKIRSVTESSLLPAVNCAGY